MCPCDLKMHSIVGTELMSLCVHAMLAFYYVSSAFKQKKNAIPILAVVTSSNNDEHEQIMSHLLNWNSI